MEQGSCPILYRLQVYVASAMRGVHTMHVIYQARLDLCAREPETKLLHNVTVAMRDRLL